MILRGKPEEEIPKIVAEYKLKFAKREVHRRKETLVQTALLNAL
jgi:hypothetical protein